MKQALKYGGVLLAVATIIATASICSPALAIEDLLTNGDFSAGHNNLPSEWHTRVGLPWTDYTWTPPTNSDPGQVEMDNHLLGDARWAQEVYLRPGWYYISGEIKSENVSLKGTGAFVALADENVGSSEALGNTDWRRLGFYLEIGKGGAWVNIVLRFGDFWDFNDGKAWFRGVSVVPVEAPSEDTQGVYHLDQVRRSLSGSPLWLVTSFVLLAVFAIVGWRLCVPDGI